MRHTLFNSLLNSIPLVVLLLLSGCTSDRPAPHVNNGAGEATKRADTLFDESVEAAIEAEVAIAVKDKDAEVKKARADALAKQTALAEERAKVKRAEEATLIEKAEKDKAAREAKEAREAMANRMIWYGVGLMVMAAMGLAVALWLKLGSLIIIAGATAAGAAVLLALGYAAPYMALVSTGLLIIVGILVVWRLILAIKVASTHADKMENAFTEDQVEQSKKETVEEQLKFGIRGLTQVIRGKESSKVMEKPKEKEESAPSP